MYIDIETSAGVKCGDGPIITAREFEAVKCLDKAGTIRFSMPSADERAALVLAKRVARCRRLVNGVVIEVGAGIVDEITAKTDNKGSADLEISGDNLLRELTYHQVGQLKIGAHHAPSTTGPSQIAALFPSGWSLDLTNGYDETVKAIHHRFEGESCLAALIKLTELTGEHFRLGTGRTVIWMQNDRPDSGIRAVQGGEPISLESNTNVCLIADLEEVEDTHDCNVGRVYCFGTGDGDSRVSLDGATNNHAGDGYIISSDSKGYYLEHTATWNVDGIERYMSFKDVYDATTLAEQAYEWMNRRLTPYKSYKLSVTKLDRELAVGSTIRVVYKRVVDGFVAIDVDDDLVILEATTKVDQKGARTVDFQVATTDAWPDDNTSATVDGLGQSQNFYTHSQGFSSGVDVLGIIAETLGKIILYRPGDDCVFYDPTSSGFDQAISASSSGDVIQVPSGTISGSHTIPSGVEIVGIGIENSILSGAITNNGILSRLRVSGTLSGSGKLYFAVDADDYVRISQPTGMGIKPRTRLHLDEVGNHGAIRVSSPEGYDATLQLYSRDGTAYEGWAIMRHREDGHYEIHLDTSEGLETFTFFRVNRDTGHTEVVDENSQGVLEVKGRGDGYDYSSILLIDHNTGQQWKLTHRQDHAHDFELWDHNGMYWTKALSIFRSNHQVVPHFGLEGNADDIEMSVFLMATFREDDPHKLYLALSGDGLTWRNLFGTGIAYTAPSGDLRDPSIVYFNNKFWVVHTNDWNGSVINPQFTVLSSGEDDIFTWGHVTDVNLSAVTDAYHVWAPEWFVDPATGAMHVFVAVSTTGAMDTFQIYEIHPTNAAMTAWSSPVAVTGTNFPADIIDPFVVYYDGKYWLWYKNDDTKYIEVASSLNLTSGYTVVLSDDWADWGSGYEGQSVVQVASGRWRVYLDKYTGIGMPGNGIYYSESTNGWVSWSPKQLASAPYTFNHPTVITARKNAAISSLQAWILDDHHASHEEDGSDEIKLDDLATPDDNTDLDATIGHHGLLPKLSGDDGDMLLGDGTWGAATPTSLTVEEQDGVPSVTNVSKIKVSNGSLTDDGGGVVSLVTGGGSGGGAPIDASYVVEDANGGLSNEKVLGDTVIPTAAHASRQAAAKSGRLFFPSDGLYLGRDGGSAWSHWGPIFPLTPPVNGDYTWVNQESATLSDGGGGIFLADVADATGIKIRKKSIPTAPYTVTMGMIPFLYAVDYNAAGICLRNSSSGKLVLFHIYGNAASPSGFYLGASKWDSPTANNSGYVDVGFPAIAGAMLFLRIVDNNTNRLFQWSLDGRNFVQLYTVGRMDFITPDEIGVHFGSLNASYPAAMSWLHWKQE